MPRVPSTIRLLLSMLAAGACAASAWAADAAARERIDALRTEAEALVAKGDWKSALEAGDRLLVACRREYGAEHAETARADILLGEARQRLGEPLLAETHFRRALEAQEKALAADDSALIVTLTHLASSLKAQERFAEATPLLRRTLELQRRLGGSAHEDTAVTARNLALLHRLQGELDKAQPLYEEALNIRRAALGESDPATLASAQELIDLYQRRGDFAAAEKCAGECVAALEKEGVAEPATLAAALIGWGALAEAQGRLADAEARYRRALAVSEQSADANDPRLAAPLTALGACLRRSGRYEEAAGRLDRALGLRLRDPASAPGDTAASHRELGWLRRAQKDFDAALPHFEKALALREAAFGEGAEETLESLAELADLHRLRGDFAAGEKLLVTRRKRIEKRSGAASPEAADAWRDLAGYCESAKRWAPAREAARTSHELRKKLFGAGDSRTLDALYLLARICAESGDAKSACEQFARLKPWFDAHPEADAGGRSEWMRQFAIATLRAGRKSEAERLFVESRDWHEKKFGPNDPATLRSLGDLWTFFDESGQGERALGPALDLAARSAQALGADAPGTLVVYERLAQLCAGQGRRGDGATWFRRAVDGARRRFGPDAPETCDALGRIALWHERAAEYAAAEPFRRERLLAIERVAGKDSDAAAMARGDLDTCLRRRPAFR